MFGEGGAYLPEEDEDEEREAVTIDSAYSMVRNGAERVPRDGESSPVMATCLPVPPARHTLVSIGGTWPNFGWLLVEASSDWSVGVGVLDAAASAVAERRNRRWKRRRERHRERRQGE